MAIKFPWTITGTDDPGYQISKDELNAALIVENYTITEIMLALAVAAKLVTNGDSHDHAGGDGAAIGEAGLATAVSDQLVTGGDAHNHVGGDGAVIPEGGLSFSDVTTGDASATQHGHCPKLSGNDYDFLAGDGTCGPPAEIEGGGGGLTWIGPTKPTDTTKYPLWVKLA